MCSEAFFCLRAGRRGNRSSFQSTVSFLALRNAGSSSHSLALWHTFYTQPAAVSSWKEPRKGSTEKNQTSRAKFHEVQSHRASVIIQHTSQEETIGIENMESLKIRQQVYKQTYESSERGWSSHPATPCLCITLWPALQRCKVGESYLCCCVPMILLVTNSACKRQEANCTSTR